MLDDFLKEDDSKGFLDELEETQKPQAVVQGPEIGFLGMTPAQRFVISVMFFFMILIIGAFCVLITGAVGIPL